MAGEVQSWAGRTGWQSRAHVLRLSHDVLLEIAYWLDFHSLLSLRQVCRALSAITRENVLFVRLLMRHQGPPIAPLLSASASSAEERVAHAYRLHKNWDLAGLPPTIRPQRNYTVSPRPPTRPIAPPVLGTIQPIGPPLPYHLPPGADAYPFLKLETYALFRDSATKTASPFGLVGLPTQAFVGPTPPGFAAGHPAQVLALAQTNFQHQPQQESLSEYPHVASVVNPQLSSPTWSMISVSAAANPPQSDSVAALGGSLPNPSPTSGHTIPSPTISRTAPAPLAAPAPRPIRVSSVSVRAIFAKIVAGGRWGVFVVKREVKDAPLDNSKGKQRADGERPNDNPGGQRLTAEALAMLTASTDPSGKGKQKAQDQDVLNERSKSRGPDAGKPMETQLGSAQLKGTDKGKPEDGVFLVVYDLDVLAAEGDKDLERAKVVEYALKSSPTSMTCQATSRGVVAVVIRPVGHATLTTVLRWDYLAPEFTNLGTHKAGCQLGTICIKELDAPSVSEQSAGDAKPVSCTLVAIVHRPRTVMIQDVDTGQRCFVKLGSMPPLEHRHSIQTVHLIPGPRLLVLRAIQGEQTMYALEEHQVPQMGETVAPTVPIQRQWIRDVEIQNSSIVEGPTHDDGASPDISLWAFATGPCRSVLHWLLRPASSRESDVESMCAELGHAANSIQEDVYASDSAYTFPAKQVCTSKLSFPHHKATLAPGARRAMWFERPDRRSSEARGMRGIWGYTSIESQNQDTQGVVRNCTNELPDDVVDSMENSTLGVAFDEASGRVVAITCGDGYSALAGSKVWILDYA